MSALDAAVAAHQLSLPEGQVQQVSCKRSQTQALQQTHVEHATLNSAPTCCTGTADNRTQQAPRTDAGFFIARHGMTEALCACACVYMVVLPPCNAAAGAVPCKGLAAAAAGPHARVCGQPVAPHQPPARPDGEQRCHPGSGNKGEGRRSSTMHCRVPLRASVRRKAQPAPDHVTGVCRLLECVQVSCW